MDAFTAIFTTSISTVTSSSEVPRNQEAHPGGMTLCLEFAPYHKTQSEPHYYYCGLSHR
ncbi:hypothetical protein AYX15_07156 [Cryptococcus neoformans]|nr:hypothetical protein AYX15_07156 [Cryptococcus neoformans var. grubii]